jgi:amino acid permease
LNPDAQIQYKVRYYSLPVAFCFTVNYVIGVGALGIPIAFRQAGWILSLIVLIIVAIISVITIGWIIEAISWAHDDCSVVHKKFEIVELAEMYLGRKGKIAFQVSLLFLMYTGLWAYSAVFVTSVIGLIGLEKWAICLIFAAMVVPLSFLDFSEQKIIQIALTVMRAGTFALMIISTIIALWTDPKDVGPTSDHKAPYIANQTFIAFSGIGSIFTTGLFSLLFQHSVPGLFHFIQPSKKSKALRVFTFAIIACLSLYLLLAMLTNLYFGADILSSVNLNWKSFSYGYEIVPAWAVRLISNIIMTHLFL